MDAGWTAPRRRSKNAIELRCVPFLTIFTTSLISQQVEPSPCPLHARKPRQPWPWPLPPSPPSQPFNFRQSVVLFCLPPPPFPAVELWCLVPPSPVKTISPTNRHYSPAITDTCTGRQVHAQLLLATTRAALDASPDFLCHNRTPHQNHLSIRNHLRPLFPAVCNCAGIELPPNC